MICIERRCALDQRNYKSGQFARKTAVSVRTLRFYDKVGLLTPSVRTPAGYRLYGDDDLVRLQHILALKFLGFSLEEIANFLATAPLNFREVLSQQKAMLRERRDQLDTVLRAIEQAEGRLERDEHDWDSLTILIRAIQMEQQSDWRKKYFTDEQARTMDEISQRAYSPEALAKLAARGPWTEEDQRGIDAQYAALYAGVRQAVAAGQAPSGPEGQALAAQAVGLLEAFTGGDPEVWAGLQQWWQHHDQLPAAQRPVQIPLNDTESAFLAQAKAIFMERREAGGAP